MKFKPLEWKKIGRGDSDLEEAFVSIHRPTIHFSYLVRTYKDGVSLDSSDSPECPRRDFSVNKSGISSIEEAKRIADKVYQKAMNNFYQEFEKYIVEE